MTCRTAPPNIETENPATFGRMTNLETNLTLPNPADAFFNPVRFWTDTVEMQMSMMVQTFDLAMSMNTSMMGLRMSGSACKAPTPAAVPAPAPASQSRARAARRSAVPGLTPILPADPAPKVEPKSVKARTAPKAPEPMPGAEPKTADPAKPAAKPKTAPARKATAESKSTTARTPKPAPTRTRKSGTAKGRPRRGTKT